MRKTKRFSSALALLLAGVMLFSETGSLLPVKAEELHNEDIKYISEKTYNSLDADAQNVYAEMCDELDVLAKNGLALRDVVFATDKDGKLYESYTIPYSIITETGAEYTEEIVSGDVSDNSPSVSENDPVEEEASPEEDVSANEDPSESLPETEDNSYISENMDLIDIFEEEETAEEEIVLGIPDNRDSLISYVGKDYFIKDLTPLELTVYNAAANRLTRGKTSFTFTVPYGTDSDFVSLSIAKSVSILTTTYLSKFNNINLAAGLKVVSTYSKGKYTYTVSVKKSSYYSSTLNTNANKKIKNIVNAAYLYASTHYPGESFTYGIVEYLNNWLCENVTENPTGLSTDETVMASKEYFFCHTIYGPLLYGYGVCEGYAKALSLMLDAAGITNIYVVSASHAYVYVMMNDDNWYIVDPMLNDEGSSSSGNYLLTGALADEAHSARGVIFKVNELDNYTLAYPDVSTNSYTASSEEFELNKQFVAVAKGKTTKLSVPNTYYADYKKTWSTGNSKIAAVSSSGKVSAVGTGKTNISCTIAGRSATCETYVYKLSRLVFDNGKSSAKKTYVNQGDFVLNSKGVPTFSGTDSFSVTVLQSGKQASAYLLYLFDSTLKDPKVTSSDKTVATVTDVVLTGDQINVTLEPKKIGTTVISVKFGGLTAKLTYTVKQQLRDEWFSAPSVSEYTYSGAARKPKVYKVGEQETNPLPSGLTTSTKYLNNINAGTATISISGKGFYSGTITRNFTINPILLTADNTKLTATSKMDYIGAGLTPSIKLYYKNTKLKKGKDFTVSYVSGSQRPESPTESGTYTVVVNGSGNYTGSLPTKTLTVNKLDASKLTLSVSNVAWNNNNTVYPKIKVSYGSTEIPRDTSIVSKKNYNIYYYKKTNEGYSKDRLTSISARGTYKVVVEFTANNIDNSEKKTLEDTITVY